MAEELAEQEPEQLDLLAEPQTAAGEKITEAAIDPRWRVGVAAFDGTQHVVLTIDHPRLGTQSLFLPLDGAQSMAAALSGAADQVAGARTR